MRRTISPPLQYHQVFISFRGAQLRLGFICFLVEALRRNGINVFIDNQENKGEDISHLLKRIEESRIAIVVFSSRYPESVWCLKEAAKVMERVKQGMLEVLPIFYKVLPSNVKQLKGEFGDYFRDKEWEYRNDKSVNIEEWKEALGFISEKIGLRLMDEYQITENSFIESIVVEVLKMLERIQETDRNAELGRNAPPPNQHPCDSHGNNRVFGMPGARGTNRMKKSPIINQSVLEGGETSSSNSINVRPSPSTIAARHPNANISRSAPPNRRPCDSNQSVSEEGESNSSNSITVRPPPNEQPIATRHTNPGVRRCNAPPNQGWRCRVRYSQASPNITSIYNYYPTGTGFGCSYSYSFGYGDTNGTSDVGGGEDDEEEDPASFPNMNRSQVDWEASGSDTDGETDAEVYRDYFNIKRP